MADILIKVKDQADKQCEKDIIGAKQWNLHEIDTFKKVGKWRKDPNCIGTVIDDHLGYWCDAFPIWKTDTLDTILPRYWKVFRWEAEFLVEYVKDERQSQYDRGFSKGKSMRFSAKLPETLNKLLGDYFPQYYNTKKGWAYLKTKIPKLFI